MALFTIGILLLRSRNKCTKNNLVQPPLFSQCVYKYRCQVPQNNEHLFPTLQQFAQNMQQKHDEGLLQMHAKLWVSHCPGTMQELLGWQMNQLHPSDVTTMPRGT
jgi:hypothetical protein